MQRKKLTSGFSTKFWYMHLISHICVFDIMIYSFPFIRMCDMHIYITYVCVCVYVCMCMWVCALLHASVWRQKTDGKSQPSSVFHITIWCWASVSSPDLLNETSLLNKLSLMIWFLCSWDSWTADIASCWTVLSLMWVLGIHTPVSRLCLNAFYQNQYQ